jgi:hypothetical protein
MPARWIFFWLFGLSLLDMGTAARAQNAAPAATASTNAAPARDVFEDLYRAYDPGFRFPDRMSEDTRKLSAEPRFFTLNLLPESARAYALIEAGKAKEAQGQFKEATEIYQKVIDEYSDVF